MNLDEMLKIRKRQIAIAADERLAIQYCYYCGKELSDEERCNADDYGLHSETVGKCCCRACDALITHTNRLMAWYTSTEYAHIKKHCIEQIINDMEEIKEKIKNMKDF